MAESGLTKLSQKYPDNEEFVNAMTAMLSVLLSVATLYSASVALRLLMHLSNRLLDCCGISTCPPDRSPDPEQSTLLELR